MNVRMKTSRAAEVGDTGPQRLMAEDSMGGQSPSWGSRDTHIGQMEWDSRGLELQEDAGVCDKDQKHLSGVNAV